ncbi:MAG: hypothetical protein N2422_01740 [Rhodobacteraceae bacterium]|nr:hypothetical protein [Paracoccaceae bacterium]
MTRSLCALALIAASALPSCTQPSKWGEVEGVAEAAPGAVAACAYVADITVKPSAYGVLESEGRAYARYQVKREARDGGANVVVFEPPRQGDDPYLVRATAYRC